MLYRDSLTTIIGREGQLMFSSGTYRLALSEGIADTELRGRVLEVHDDFVSVRCIHPKEWQVSDATYWIPISQFILVKSVDSP